MNKNSKIYIAGHRGLVGSAIMHNLYQKGYTNIVYRTHKELDLLSQKDVYEFFCTEKPEYVFLAAAKVGGIMANNIYRADFIYQNLQIQNNVINASYKNNVKKLLFLGSSCIYPKNAPQPMSEDCLLTSELEYTNEPYAIAKIAGIKMCESYNLQYGTNFLSIMPTNLYGPNDNFDLENSHVLPAIIRKVYLAKLLSESNYVKIAQNLNCNIENNLELDSMLSKYGINKQNGNVNLTLWGSGKPRREFLYSDDMADACVFIMNNVNFSDLILGKDEIKNTHINIGTGEDISIYDLAFLIKDIFEFNGNIQFDTTKPDGTLRKLQNINKLSMLGWHANVDLVSGIKNVINYYLNNN